MVHYYSLSSLLFSTQFPTIPFHPVHVIISCRILFFTCAYLYLPRDHLYFFILIFLPPPLPFSFRDCTNIHHVTVSGIKHRLICNIVSVRISRSKPQIHANGWCSFHTSITSRGEILEPLEVGNRFINVFSV